jgi:hypothetical protein
VTRIPRPVTFGVPAAALGMLVSCATLSEGARDNFARITKCSPDQVSVMSRPDFQPPAAPSSPDLPPVGRGRRQHLASQESENTDCDMFEATGCGKRLILCCDHPLGTDSSGAPARHTERVECLQIDGGSPQEADASPSAPPSLAPTAQ